MFLSLGQPFTIQYLFFGGNMTQVRFDSTDWKRNTVFVQSYNTKSIFSFYHKNSLMNPPCLLPLFSKKTYIKEQSAKKNKKKTATTYFGLKRIFIHCWDISQLPNMPQPSFSLNQKIHYSFIALTCIK